MRFGVQVSIARGPQKALEYAVERGCEAVQIFSSNPRGWALSRSSPGADEAMRASFEEHGISPILLHAPYLVNIAAADPDVYARSVSSLVHAADRGRRLDGFVIVHAGRNQRTSRIEGLRRAAAAVLTARKLVPGARILVEPTAGGRGSVASTVDELAELLDVIDDPEVGVCLDTCHAHAAGHALATRAGAKSWLRQLTARIGLERLGAIHVNDSRDPAGSGRDRHWHLGEGTIGAEGFAAILSDRRLASVPGILETPGKLVDDKRNLAKARAFAGLTKSR